MAVMADSFRTSIRLISTYITKQARAIHNVQVALCRVVARVRNVNIAKNDADFTNNKFVDEYLK